MPPASRGPTRGSQPKAISDFCARVKLLIDRYDDGNVTAAARRLRVSQRGLQKVYVGETTEPRLTLVQALVRVYRGADARWILLGDESAGGISDRSYEKAVESQAQVLLSRMIREMNGPKNQNADDARDPAPRRRRRSG